MSLIRANKVKTPKKTLAIKEKKSKKKNIQKEIKKTKRTSRLRRKNIYRLS